MNRNKFKIVGVTVISFALLLACSKSTTSVQFGLSSLIDVSGSNASADHFSTSLWFSTDGGTTYVNFPTNIHPGSKFKVKVHDDVTGIFLDNLNCYGLDWSASDPKPDDATSDSPSFTLAGNNQIKVTVVDVAYAPFQPKKWLGTWFGDETNTTCCGGSDENVITQDATDPNKFWMDNWWGDHVSAYFTFSTSTSVSDQIITLPAQTTSEGGSILAGTGTYDQCTGLFNMTCSYTFDNSTFYTWTYQFHR